MRGIAGPHRRYNPLLDEWVLCSPQRLERPWQGDVGKEGAESSVAYDPTCYLCPGNPRANGQKNPPYAATYVFDNDFPALDGRTADPPVAEGLLVARSERGRCRVVCFSPRHDLTLARMRPAEIRPVVDTWASEVESLSASATVRYVQVFENKGAMMGCSNPHPHCQVWAVETVPSQPQRKLETQRRYLDRNGKDLLGAYLEQELSDEERVVCQNSRFVALVPFWAVWPFELLLLPRRRVGDLQTLDSEERDALAAILSEVTIRYDNLFQCSFPYSMGWCGRPTDGGEHPSWRLHAAFLPPLLRSATIRKYLVGYELSAEPQRDLTPEEAAARLRAAPLVHYLDRT